MEREEIKIRDRLTMRGLKNKGLLEILQDSKPDSLVLIMSQGIRKNGCYLIFLKECGE